jgi:hypothetical protein
MNYNRRATMIIETRIAGIPCLVEADVFVSQGSYSRNAASDWDYYGWAEVGEFTIMDRRGRPAPWLERKLTNKEIERIESEFMEAA